MNFMFMLRSQENAQQMYNELLNYKKHGSYPIAISKEQKYVIRRRSASFLLDGEPW